MRKGFKRDLIYEYLEKIQIDTRKSMIERVANKVEELRLEVSELKHFGVNENFLTKFRFFQHLKGLLFFLENQMKMENLDDRVFNKFVWIAEKLVQKGEMEEMVLELFNEN